MGVSASASDREPDPDTRDGGSAPDAVERAARRSKMRSNSPSGTPEPDLSRSPSRMRPPATSTSLWGGHTQRVVEEVDEELFGHTGMRD